MSATASVLGVLGLCWVGFDRSPQGKAPKSVACRESVMGVLGLRTRARMRVSFHQANIAHEKNPYARAKKLNTPNTPYTVSFKALNPLGFECVGFVLGWMILCWVSILEGAR